MHIHDRKGKLSTKFQEEINSLTSISISLILKCWSNRPQHQSRDYFCTAFPKHIYVSKLCMHIHDRKGKLSTKFQEEINSLTSISISLILKCWSNRPQHQSRDYFCTAFPKHIYVSKLCMHIHDRKGKLSTKFQEEINSLTSISISLKLKCWSNCLKPNRRVNYERRRCSNRPVVVSLHINTSQCCWTHDTLALATFLGSFARLPAAIETGFGLWAEKQPHSCISLFWIAVQDGCCVSVWKSSEWRQQTGEAQTGRGCLRLLQNIFSSP